MNPAQMAVEYIVETIPRIILEDAFLDTKHRAMRGIDNMEGVIHEKIIRKVLSRDLSLKGGVTFDVELEGLGYELIDQFTRAYTIPPERREGRDIVRVTYASRSIYSGSTNIVPNYVGTGTRTQGLMHNVEKMLRANQPLDESFTADIDILAPNVIAIRDYDVLMVCPILKCKLAFSPNLEEITPPWQSVLNDLALLAAKKHIFLQLELELDLGKLEHGRELGKYGDYVSNLADASTLYSEELDKWSKFLILMDKRSAQAVYRTSGN